MKRIGIIGGTFNPIHIGHLAIANVALDSIQLDKVIFVPCNLPPQKSSEGIIPAKHRYQMVKLAIKNNPKFVASDFEIKRPGKSYTIDTLRYIKNKYPQAKLYFIIGGDWVKGLNTWQNIDEILQYANFIAVNRTGYKVKAGKIKVHNVYMPGIDVSSSLIRHYIEKGKSIKYLLPDNVLEYINKYKIYSKK